MYFDIHITFQLHSKCILGIPAAFYLNSWMPEPHRFDLGSK